MTISELYSLFRKHPVITTDSRNCPPGSLFFALKGKNFDGNKFAEQALNSGCAYAIVDDASVVTNKQMILTENVLYTLQQLANIHRKTFKIPVIGITGTNGKTTTKELTAAVLSQKYKVLCTIGNLNNHIGVPLTLLRLNDEHEIAVIEMGANHPDEIGELASITCPDYGLITNVGYAHLEGFVSLEGVIKAKGALYDYLRETDGTVFIHQENDHLTAIAGGIKKITYGVLKWANESTEEGMIEPTDEGESRQEGLKPDTNQREQAAFIGGRVTFRHPFLSLEWQQNRYADVLSAFPSKFQNNHDAIHTVNTKLVGDYNLWNVLAAITIGAYFVVPSERINEAIASYEPTNNRSQLKKTTQNELIIDAYNANPSSIQAALENFAAMPFYPKAVILGDMLELGEKSPELHLAVIRQIKTGNYDKVLLCGKNFSEVGQQYSCFPTVEQLIEHLKAHPLQGYHILIKGSHGISLEKTIAYL